MKAYLTTCEVSSKVNKEKEPKLGFVVRKSVDITVSLEFAIAGDATPFETMPEKAREAFLQKVSDLLEDFEFEVEDAAQ